MGIALGMSRPLRRRLVGRISLLFVLLVGLNGLGDSAFVNRAIATSSRHITKDQSDLVMGFQVKPIYVVPSDGVDHSYDTNGYIAGILNEGNKYLHDQLGLQVPIDRTSTGYDIQYLKSHLSTADFQRETNLAVTLLTESMDLDNPGLNRKDYIFFVDVNILSDKACGVGGTPGISAVIAIGGQCAAKVHTFSNYAAWSWPHELIHNFGVTHTLNDPCDFMRGSETPGICPATSKITIDKNHTRYVGSSAQGRDILKLRVWEGRTSKRSLQANCFLNPVPRADGMNYAYCPTGTQAVGALTSCWSSITSVTLQEFLRGAWKDLGPGRPCPDPWGLYINCKCTVDSTAPAKLLTVLAPKISLYRWMVNGSEGERFKLIWVR